MREGSLMGDGSSVVSLFSGCGGLDLGFVERGFDVVYACDNDPAAVDCYARNVGGHVHLRDVTSAAFHDDISNIGACDVVLGGFPCQGFSKAGPKKAGDTRNTLYEGMRHAIARLRPRAFVAENVDGMAQNFSGAFVERIRTDLAQAGYDVECRILDAAAFGVPQHRRRIFFVGVRRPVGRRFLWPVPTHAAEARNGEFKVGPGSPGQLALWGEQPGGEAVLRTARTVRDAISDLRSLDVEIPDHRVTDDWPANYAAVFHAIKPGQKLCNVRHAVTSVHTWEISEVYGETTGRERQVLEAIAKNRRRKEHGDIPNGNPLGVEVIERLSGLGGVRPDIDALLSKGYLAEKSGKYDLKEAMFCSGLFKRPRWDQPSPTVLTNFHNPRYFLHPFEDRPFSLRECARLQGFPDTFLFTGPEVDLVGGYRLVGNAVPPPLSRLFAAAVSRVLVREEELQAV